MNKDLLHEAQELPPVRFLCMCQVRTNVWHLDAVEFRFLPLSSSLLGQLLSSHLSLRHLFTNKALPLSTAAHACESLLKGGMLSSNTRGLINPDTMQQLGRA